MKLKSSNAAAIKSEGLNISTVGFQVEKINQMSSVLRDMIYSDKVLAPIRELVANAVDEHNQFNVDKDIVVKIEKTDGQYWFSVRDFAKGLSDDGVRKVWGMYFESTKTNSSSQVGGFGVGAKSIFAISDNNTIVSYHNGIKTVYSAFLDLDKNGFGVGKIAEVHSEPTTETGIEVSIPFNKDRLDEFLEKAKRIVQNCSQDTKIVLETWDGQTFRPEEEKVITIDENLSITYSNRGSGIRMGSIVYPIPKFVDLLHDNHNQIFSEQVIFDVPIGTFGLAISREELNDIPENRRRGEEIKKKILDFKDNFIDKSKIETTDFHGSYITRTPFQYSVNNIFPEISYLNAFNKVQDNSAKKNKVVIIPNNGASYTWKNRLVNIAHRLPTDFNYISTSGEGKEEFIEKLADVDEVVQIKKLGIAKLENNGNKNPSSSLKEYNFYLRHGGWVRADKEKYTIKDFLELIPDRKPKDCKTIKELNEICIYKGPADHSGVYNVCKTAHKELTSTGKVWDYYDKKVLEVREKLTKKQREKEEKDRLVSSITQSRYLYSPRTIKIARDKKDKFEDRLNQIAEIVQKIKNEKNSVRAEFLDELRSYTAMKRSSVRQIMRKFA